MTFTSTQWEWRPGGKEVPPDIAPVVIETCRSRDGTRYAIRQAGACLNKDGTWEIEPIPSSRDEAFFARCRFDTWHEAALLLKNRRVPVGGRFQHYLEPI